MMQKIGYLTLENGIVFEGFSFGFPSETAGEVVFNTGMTGYPETFTDPSYRKQILVLTYPLIGNYGMPAEVKAGPISSNYESYDPHIQALIVSGNISDASHWQSFESLGKYLLKHKIPALCSVDTRSLTKIIRNSGVLKGYISFNKPRQKAGFSFMDIDKLNLIEEVSCKKEWVYSDKGRINIAVLDCGLKYNQLRIFEKLEARVKIYPFNMNPFTDKDNLPDGLFISNGPGDPKMAEDTIKIVKNSLDLGIPTFGICLGHQIMALAAGADTYKLKYGHRSQNQPVKDLVSGKSYITSQNHGFAVRKETLKKGWKEWFINLNDGTNEGIRHEIKPFFSVQFHPEASPGPTDTEWLFNFFLSHFNKHG